MTTPFIIGAYASVPAEAPARDEFHELLAAQDWVDGLEIPFPGNLATDVAEVASRIAPGWDANTITAIPGTMQRVGGNPNFGLASPDEGGRVEALAFAREIRDRVAELGEALGRSSVAHVQLHSAPTAKADADALRRSLAEVLDWDWSGARIVIEHCDSHIVDQRPEKGFLSIEDEIEVAVELGLGIHINWGRSALEFRDADAPARHIRAAADAGVLAGVLFSGASGEATSYGGPWADGHLPARIDEPASLMGAEQIRDCASAALSGGVTYLGAKVCVPSEATPAQRIAMLRNVHQALPGA